MRTADRGAHKLWELTGGSMYYRSLNAYLRETFGCKVYKLALSTGCTCPNLSLIHI